MIVDPLTSRDWDQEAAQHPDVSVFHSSAWARVLHETYGHLLLYLRIPAPNGPAALLPIAEVRSRLTGVRGVSLPFSDHCGPLVFDKSAIPEIRRAIGKLSLRHGWHYAEIRSANSVDIEPSFAGHVLDLAEEPAALFKNLSVATRGSLRKSLAAPLEVAIHTDASAMRDYFLLHKITRQRQGTPPQPERFFQSIHHRLIAAGKGFIATACHLGIPVASAVFLQMGRRVTFKFGASDLRAQAMRPNNLVMWKAIEEAIRRGANRLDFGRTSLTNAGLLRFKRGWGAAEFPIAYECIGGTRHTTRPPSSTPSLFRFFPSSVNQLAGHLLYPHLD